MEWIERIENTVDGLKPVYVAQDGTRTVGSLKQCKTKMTIRGYQAAVVKDMPLRSLSRTSSDEYLTAMGLADVSRDGHEVYIAEYEGLRIYLPAAVLLQALISRLSLLGDRLLLGSSLPSVAKPMVKDGQLAISTENRVVQSSKALIPSVQARLQWLACFLSARQMWSSVYQNAARGVLGLSLPAANIDGTVIGFRKGDAVYASRLHIKTLRPTEVALPFARAYVPNEFTFATDVDRDGLKAFQAAGNHSSIKSDDSIPSAPHGWRMTDDEWHQVLHLLRQRGYTTRVSAKKPLNLALEKFGAGIRWKSEQGFKSSQSLIFLWRQSGKWEHFLEALRAVRGS